MTEGQFIVMTILSLGDRGCSRLADDLLISYGRAYSILRGLWTRGWVEREWSPFEMRWGLTNEGWDALRAEERSREQ